MSKKVVIILTVLSIISLGLSITSINLVIRNKVKDNTKSSSDTVASSEDQEEDIQYVLYLGTNDKDTNEPVFEPDEAKKKAEEILLDHFGGYTIQEANGGWKDGDTVYSEYSLVIYLSDTDIDSVHKACDEMIKVFNQSSVLVQSNKTTTEFYSTGE